jgi:hypothetical protein
MPSKFGKKKVGFVKKVKRSASRFVKKRYGVGKKRSLNVGQMARDVASLATMINAEKKIYNLGNANVLSTGQVVGQVDYNSTGIRVYDITPMMPQGSGASDRTGNSIKLHSSYYQFQVNTQTGVNSAIKMRIEMWANPGLVIDSTNLLDKLYVSNPFTGLIDYNSARNPDHFNDFRKLYTKTVYFPADNITGQFATKQFAIPFKWNRGKGHHVRYTGTGYTNPLTDLKSGQFFMVYFADSGNSNAVQSTLTTIPIIGALSGLQVKFTNRSYYYDN